MTRKMPNIKIFNCIYVILMVSVFVKYVFDINIPISLILVVFIMASLVSDKTELIVLTLICIPLNSSFQYVYALTIILVIYCVRYAYSLVITYNIFIPVLILFLELVHDISNDYSYMNSVKVIIPIFLVLIITSDSEINSIGLTKIFEILSLSTLVLCSVVFVKALSNANYRIVTMFRGGYRLGVIDESVEIMGANFNPNFLGFMCVMCICLLFQLIEAGKYKIQNTILCIAFGIFGALSMSRTFFLCMVIVLAMYIIGQRSIKMIKYTAIIIFLLVIVYFFAAKYYPSILNMIGARFRVEDLSNGRNSLFAMYNEIIFDDIKLMLCGIGVSGLGILVESRGIINFPHNGVQELILLWGFPGIILIAIIVFSILKKSFVRRDTKPTILNYMLMTAFFIKIMAGQFMTFAPNTIILMLCFLSFIYGKTSNTSEIIPDRINQENHR